MTPSEEEQASAHDRSITVVVPTFNRPMFLRRKLADLAAQGVAGRIIVIDSSDKPERSENERLCEATSSLVIDYQFEEGAHFAKKLLLGCSQSSTPYTLVTFDDDLLAFDTVRQLRGVLEENAQYSSANGRVVSMIKPRRDGPSRVATIGSAYLPSHELAADRIGAFLRSSLKRNPLFNLWRTPVLKEIWAPIAHQPWRKSVEVLFDHLAVYSGPAFLSSRVLEFRHVDYEKVAYRQTGLKQFGDPFYQELLSKEFVPVFGAALEQGVRWIVESDSMDEEAARNLFTHAFLLHRVGPRLQQIVASSDSRRPTRSVGRTGKLLSLASKPGRILRYVRARRLYDRASVSRMLGYDPDFRYSHASLMRDTGPDGVSYRRVQDLLAEFTG